METYFWNVRIISRQLGVSGYDEGVGQHPRRDESYVVNFWLKVCKKFALQIPEGDGKQYQTATVLVELIKKVKIITAATSNSARVNSKNEWFGDPKAENYCFSWIIKTAFSKKARRRGAKVRKIT